MTGMSAIGGMQAPAFQPPSFSSLDTNSDDGISLDELKSNAPGGVSDTQSDARAEELFKSMDADNSGTVTDEEKSSFDSEMESRLASMSFVAQLIGGQPPEAQSIVSAIDSDDDGVVSFEEFSTSEAAQNLESETIEQLFASIDQDSDGLVSEEEISSFLAESKPQGGPRGAGGPPPPPPSGSASIDEDDEDTETSQLIEMISNAINAYQSSGTNQDSLTSALFEILEDAA